ncbi:hypothetical protein Nepgr_000514 [Nepenthes gracilis]|uniref:SUI1 domain-containing protein n=1 Tax=Nepenthes gracilis TaxID=150966 RepID=A0AAD3P4K9_NEPGR|nr:hypothetical protein Nepgr_000514 [Nepenthes gracilis]
MRVFEMSFNLTVPHVVQIIVITLSQIMYLGRSRWITRRIKREEALPNFLSNWKVRFSILIIYKATSLPVVALQFQPLSFMSELIQIPTAFDPFAEANGEDSGAGAKEYVHIRTQQRNGRKSLTTVQGLKKEFSYSKILKDLKKEFCCNGTVVQDPELGQVIQLQGDQRKNVSTFLVQAGIVKKEHIKIHGF